MRDGFYRRRPRAGNNVAVSRVFTERINKKYDMMYGQRAFVHWCGAGQPLVHLSVCHAS